MKKLFNYLVINDDNSFIYRIVLRQLRVLIQRFLYPEFNFNWFAWVWSLKYAFLIIISPFIIYWVAYNNGFNKIEKNAIELYHKNINLHNHNDSLQNNIDSILESKNYLRFRIYDTTGVLIPKNIPYEHLKLMYSEANKYKIPLKIYFKLIKTESRFEYNLRSEKNAVGYMQITPIAYKHYAPQLKIDEMNANNNIRIGSFMLFDLYNFWKSKKINEKFIWEKVLRSYNAGVTATMNGKAYNYLETNNYVCLIMN
jgi:soluble lytic murein transglycosylase-like protein